MKVDKYFRQCVGIDVAKDTFMACLSMLDIATDEGRSSQTVEFANNKHGFNQLVKWSRKEAVREAKLTFLMEVTGVYHEKLAHHLQKLGFQVYVVLSSRARKYAEYEGIKTKTDSMDAYALSRFGCAAHHLVPWTPPKPIYAALRMKTRFASHLNKVRTTIGNQLHALSNSFEKDAALERMYKSLIDKIDKELEDNDKAIEELIDTDAELKSRIEKVCSITSVGMKTAVTVIAETGAFEFITSQKQLVSYAGLDVVSSQSGPNDPRHHISKKGNVYIRAALYMPAINACMYNKRVSELYERVKEKNPNARMVAVTAGMRKLLIQIYTIWKKNELFDKQR